MNIPYWLQLVAMTGATAVIVYGSVLKRPRQWLMNRYKILKEFLSCSMCVGFWVGVGASYLVNAGDIILHLTFGFASSATSWLYDSLVGSTQSIEVFYSRKNK